MPLFICFGIWTVAISLIIWQTNKIVKEAITYVKRLHKIPCSNCAYFTGDYRLKCTVHPIIALSEEALNCKDFELCYTKSNPQFKKGINKITRTYNKVHSCDSNCQNQSLNQITIQSN